MRPRRIALQSLTGQLVMVDDGNVRVHVPAVGIVMDHNHVLNTKSRRRELLSNLDSTGNIPGLGDVELGRIERKDEVVDLVLTSVATRLSLGILDERLRRLHRAGVPCCTRRTVADVLTVLLATPVERVSHRATST
ncbi:hypothetical protein QWU43_05065 [Corynebacterium sp. CCM 9204]